MRKLSIIVPVYDVEKYLRKCLNSLLDQKNSKEDYEVIIINDGSPDDSQIIIDEYVSSNSNFSCFIKENGGLSSARNLGIENAKGEYIFFLDSDDYVEKDSLKYLLDNLYNNEVDCLAFEYQEVNESGSILKKKVYYDNTNTISSGEFLNKYTLVPNSTRYLFKRKIINDNNLRFTQGIFHEDEEFTAIFISYCSTIRYTDIMVYNYFQREGSIMNSNSVENNKKKINDSIIVIESINKRKSETSGLLRIGLSKRIELLLVSVFLKMKVYNLDFGYVEGIITRLKYIELYPLNVEYQSFRFKAASKAFNYRFFCRLYYQRRISIRRYL